MSNRNAPRRTISKGRTQPPNKDPFLPCSHPDRRSPSKAAVATILRRCSSVPSLPSQSCDDNDDHEARSRPPHFSRQTSMVLLTSPFKQENGDETWKVVVSVTVEGSPGPVRMMVSKAATVEETIRLVVDKYRDEGRTPRLFDHGLASLELHSSYFSLQSLDRTEKIGGVGSRSFYLRKANNGGEDPTKQSRLTKPDIRFRGGETVTGNSCCREEHVNSGSLCSMILPPLCFSFTYVARNIGRFGRTLRKIWGFFGCMICG